MNILFRSFLGAIALWIIVVIPVNAAIVSSPTGGCGDHDNFCMIETTPTTYKQNNPGVPEPGTSLADRFDTFDTIYFDVEGENRLLNGSVNPSPDVPGFDGGVFDNDLDVWWGKFVDLDNDGGNYTLVRTDAEGNFDPSALMTNVIIPELDIGSPRYHLHFYTENDSGNPDYTYEFDLSASAVPLPAAVWMMLMGLSVLGLGFCRKAAD